MKLWHTVFDAFKMYGSMTEPSSNIGILELGLFFLRSNAHYTEKWPLKLLPHPRTPMTFIVSCRSELFANSGVQEADRTPPYIIGELPGVTYSSSVDRYQKSIAIQPPYRRLNGAAWR